MRVVLAAVSAWLQCGDVLGYASPEGGTHREGGSREPDGSAQHLPTPEPELEAAPEGENHVIRVGNIITDRLIDNIKYALTGETLSY